MSVHFLRDDLDPHRDLRFDAEHQDLGWVHPEVADVEGVLALELIVRSSTAAMVISSS